MNVKTTIKMNLETEIKNVLENCACLGRDAYGSYIDKMTKYLLKRIEEDKQPNKKK